MKNFLQVNRALAFFLYVGQIDGNRRQIVIMPDLSIENLHI